MGVVCWRDRTGGRLGQSHSPWCVVSVVPPPPAAPPAVLDERFRRHCLRHLPLRRHYHRTSSMVLLVG